MRVKVDFTNDRDNSTATAKLADLTFIIQEPRPSFVTPAACKHRDSPFTIYWELWIHIQCFHFVYASPHQQAELYSRLDIPHYSESAYNMMKLEIASFIKANPGLDCVLQYHLPNKMRPPRFDLFSITRPLPLTKYFRKQIGNALHEPHSQKLRRPSRKVDHRQGSTASFCMLILKAHLN
jgi:hypothetical protein